MNVKQFQLNTLATLHNQNKRILERINQTLESELKSFGVDFNKNEIHILFTSDFSLDSFEMSEICVFIESVLWNNSIPTSVYFESHSTKDKKIVLYFDLQD